MQLRFSPLGPLARGRSGSPGPGLALPFEPRGPGRLLPPRGWGREGAAAARAVPALVSEGASTRLLPGRETPTVTPRLPRSARVRCVRPARSAPTSSTRCPSPRPSGQPLGSGRCEPPPSLGAGLDSAPGGVRSLGGAPVAEWLLGLLFRTGARPGQRPGIPGPRHGSRSVSEHGPLTDRVARDRPSGPGCRVHSGASGGDASPRPRGQSQAAGGAGPTPGEARTGGHGSRALCPGRGHPSPGPSSAAGSGPVWLVTSGSAVPGRP